MTFRNRRALVVLAALCLVLVTGGCSEKKKKNAIEPAGSQTPAGSVQPDAPSSGGSGAAMKSLSKWDRLLEKVPNLERKEQCLADAKIAREAYLAWKKATGDERDKLQKRIIEYRTKAGDLYDMLREDVEEVDEVLWKRKFYSFDKQYDRLMKGLSRVEYRSGKR